MSINKSSRLHFYVFAFTFLPLSKTHTGAWKTTTKWMNLNSLFHKKNGKCASVWTSTFFECIHECVRLKVLWQPCNLSSTSVKDCLTLLAETRIQRMGLSPWHQTNNLKSLKRFPTLKTSRVWRLPRGLSVAKPHGNNKNSMRLNQISAELKVNLVQNKCQFSFSQRQTIRLLLLICWSSQDFQKFRQGAAPPSKRLWNTLR